MKLILILLFVSLLGLIKSEQASIPSFQNLGPLTKFQKVIKTALEVNSEIDPSVDDGHDSATSNPSSFKNHPRGQEKDQKASKPEAGSPLSGTIDMSDSIAMSIKAKLIDALERVREQTQTNGKNQHLEWTKINKYLNNIEKSHMKEFQSASNPKQTSQDPLSDTRPETTSTSPASIHAQRIKVGKQEEKKQDKTGQAQNLRSLGSGIGTNLCLMFIGFIMVIIA